MTEYSRNKLYRNTRDAKIMGVCAGLADYLDVRVGVVRFLTLVGCILSGGWGFVLYFVVGFILDPKPEYLYREDDARRAQREAMQPPRSYRPSRRERRHARREARRHYWQSDRPATPDYDTRDIKRRFEEIERRAQKLEAYMTSKKFRLDRELRGLED